VSENLGKSANFSALPRSASVSPFVWRRRTCEELN